MPSQERELAVSILGPVVDEERVPVVVVADKLRAAQRLLFSVAQFLAGGGRRGAWRADVLDTCSLLFRETRPGSLQILSEIPDPRQTAFTPELGLDALRNLSGALDAIMHRDGGALARMFPDSGQRARIMSAALPLLPDEEAEYSVVVRSAWAEAELAPTLRPFITSLSRPVDLHPDEIQTLVGKLYRIEVDTGSRHLGVNVSNRHVKCYFTPDLEDLARDLVPGAYVELEGRVTLDGQGKVQQVEDVFDVRPVEVAPLEWRRIVYEGRRFLLHRPVHIEVEYSDGVWLHRLPVLDIAAYGSSRRESLEAFRNEFASIWDSVAQEDPEKLSEDALDLQGAMQALVESVER